MKVYWNRFSTPVGAPRRFYAAMVKPWWLARLCAMALVVSGAPVASAGSVILSSPVASAAPTASGDAYAPGLAVSYFYGENFLFESVDAFSDRDPSTGVPGPPLLTLDYHTGEDLVLTSTQPDGVAAHISGHIHLAAAGTYQFAFESNDGVRLHLQGKFVVEDPDVHFDQFSQVAEVTVNTPGWYPITVWYFEKRHTSTLRLFWRGPGAASGPEMWIVPAEAFRHPKK